MHFKIDRTAFLNELNHLQGVAGAKQVIPILSHLLIETRADRITLRVTDLDLTITTICEASVREDGSICLPARKLTEIVKSLAHGEVEIKVSDLNQATITSNGSRFKLNGVAAQEFPEPKDSPGEFTEVPAGSSTMGSKRRSPPSDPCSLFYRRRHLAEVRGRRAMGMELSELKNRISAFLMILFNFPWTLKGVYRECNPPLR